MNKKFSTLVAGVLLAASIGTANAASYNSYVKSAAIAAQSVKTVEDGKAYQLVTDGKVLVMTEQTNGTMKLEMVAPAAADLLSSLWTIATSDDAEGGVSFTFVNKATGLPLAFNSSDAKLNGDNAANAMGNVSLWKWRSGVSVNSPANLVSYFHKDSALVLQNNADVISAKKVFAKENPTTSSFSVNAYEANSVVLGVNALNTMLGIQPTDGKMKLGFTRDQVKGAENIWLKEYSATTAVGDNAVSKAALAASTAAANVNTVAGVVAVIDNTISAGYTLEQKNAVYAISAAAATGTSVADAKAKVVTEVAKYTAAAASATHKYDYAKLQETAIKALTIATFSAFETAVNSATVTNATLKTDAIALVPEADYSLTAAKTAIAGMVTAYTEKNAVAVQKDAIRVLVDAEIDKLTSADHAAFVSDVQAITLSAVDQTVLAEMLQKASSVTEAETGGAGSFVVATAQTAAKGKLAEYTTAATAAAADLADVTAINAKVVALTGVNSKADYDAAVDGVSVGASSATNDEQAVVKAAMKALVTGSTFVKPTDTAILAVVRSFEDAKLVAALEKTASDAASTVAAAYVADKAAVVAAINATKQSYYSTEENDAVDAISTAANAAGDLAGAITAAQTEAADYITAAVDYVSLISKNNTDASKIEYLRVDTAYLTSVAKDKYQLAFATGKYNANLKNAKGVAVDSHLQNDFNGRYNFKFTYYPTQDSLMIQPASYVYPYTDKNYVDMTNQNVADAQAGHAAQEYVKLAILAQDHREVTVGAVDKANTTTSTTTINTRIYLNGNANYERTTLASGVYFFNLKTDLKARQDDNNKFRVASYCGDNAVSYEAEEMTQRFGQAQDFNHMPRTQWVVEQNNGVAGIQTVTITNREHPAISYKNVQLYKAGDNVFAPMMSTAAGIDTLAYAKVATEYTTDKYLGYKKFEKAIDYEKFYNLDYLSGIELGNYVNFKADSTVYVDLKGAKTYIELVPSTEDTEFGFASTKANAVQLFKAGYKLRVHNETLLTTGNYYVTISKDAKSFVITKDNSGVAPAIFTLKENNQLVSEENDTTCYYALQQVGTYTENDKDYVGADMKRVGVRDASLAFTPEQACDFNAEKRIATFAVVEDNTPLYRRLGVSKADDGLKDMTVQNAKIYTVNSAAKEYLYEDASSKYSAGKGINFLGLEDKGVTAKSAMFVDTAYVRSATNMPQYMLVMSPQIVKADTIWCNATTTHKHATLADSLACPHTTIIPASITGRYLINAEDSVAKGNMNYVWNSKYTRLAFVEAKHIGDTLVIFRNGKPSTAAADSIFLGNNDHNKTTAARPNGIKNPVFAFRLVNSDACDFLIETAGDHKIPSEGKGKWVAVKNGVPVVAAYQTYTDAIADAEIFNIEPTSEEATSNDKIGTTEVQVIAGNGVVTIKGAAGKSVAISNILGQTIVNTVLTSDNATITVPAGIVVVAVEGEEAVKTVVK